MFSLIAFIPRAVAQAIPLLFGSVGETITEQTKRVCENLAAVLEEAGSSLENTVKTVCFLSDMADFAEFNEEYAKHFTGKPARSCVAVKALPKNALLEIEVIAEIGGVI